MRRASFAALVVLAFCAHAMSASAKDDTNDYISIDLSSNAVYRIATATNGFTALTDSNSVPKLWFPVGEAMTYDIYWGFIHVGTSRITTDWVAQNGQPRLRIRHVTKTNRAVATLYPVEDILETVIDPGPFLPVYFRKTLSEGRYHADELTVFHHDSGILEQGSFRNHHVKTYKIEHDTRDLVTMMYFMRKTPFESGTTNTCRVMADDRIYDLTLRVRSEETQTIDLYGDIKTLRLDPEAAFNGLFIRKGKITFWISHDQRQLCTQVEASVPVANIRVKLASVDGPGDDAWVRPPDDPAHSDSTVMPRR